MASNEHGPQIQIIAHRTTQADMSRKLSIRYYAEATGRAGTGVYLEHLLRFARTRVNAKVVQAHPTPWPLKTGDHGDPELDVVGMDAPQRPERRHGDVLRKLWRWMPRPLRMAHGELRQARAGGRLLRQAGDGDIVHLNTVSSLSSVLAAKMFTTSAVVATIHVLPGQATLGRDLMEALIEQAWAAMPDHLIAVSRSTKKAWVRRYRVNPAKITVIHNGIDVRRFRPGRPAADVRRELGIPAECRVLGVTGRLHPVKGHTYLLQALPDVVRQHPDVRLVLIGDGNLRAVLEEEVARLCLQEVVHFAGHRSDVADITNVYDIAVLPSLQECMPFAALEAMALGKPVVASRCGGIPELVQDGSTGLMVERRKPGMLAGAILKLLENPSLVRAMGDAGQQRVRAEFSVSEMLEKTFALYDVLASRRRRKLRLKGRKDDVERIRAESARD